MRWGFGVNIFCYVVLCFYVFFRCFLNFVFWVNRICCLCGLVSICCVCGIFMCLSCCFCVSFLICLGGWFGLFFCSKIFVGLCSGNGRCWLLFICSGKWCCLMVLMVLRLCLSWWVVVFCVWRLIIFMVFLFICKSIMVVWVCVFCVSFFIF